MREQSCRHWRVDYARRRVVGMLTWPLGDPRGRAHAQWYEWVAVARGLDVVAAPGAVAHTGCDQLSWWKRSGSDDSPPPVLHSDAGDSGRSPPVSAHCVLYS